MPIDYVIQMHPLRSDERVQVQFVPKKRLEMAKSQRIFECKFGTVTLMADLPGRIPNAVTDAIAAYIESVRTKSRMRGVHLINAPMHLYFEGTPITRTPQTIRIHNQNALHWGTCLLHSAKHEINYGGFGTPGFWWYGTGPVWIVTDPQPITPYQADTIIDAYLAGKWFDTPTGARFIKQPVIHCSVCGQIIPPQDFWHHQASKIYCLTCYGLTDNLHNVADYEPSRTGI